MDNLSTSVLENSKEHSFKKRRSEGLYKPFSMDSYFGWNLKPKDEGIDRSTQTDCEIQSFTLNNEEQRCMIQHLSDTLKECIEYIESLRLCKDFDQDLYIFKSLKEKANERDIRHKEIDLSFVQETKFLEKSVLIRKVKVYTDSNKSLKSLAYSLMSKLPSSVQRKIYLFIKDLSRIEELQCVKIGVQELMLRNPGKKVEQRGLEIIRLSQEIDALRAGLSSYTNQATPSAIDHYINLISSYIFESM